MPTTINGIGTRYAGRSNVEITQGQCEHCHSMTSLETYETRLWFCFLYIPLIPLGRKQILDYCQTCTWHRAINWSEWDRIRSEAISESASLLRDQQESPEAGLQMLGTLIGFRKRDEATRLARLLKDQHEDHFAVQMQAGGWLEHAGLQQEAEECFERAWELEPENPAARRAWGMTLAERGHLEEARPLLGLQVLNESADPGMLLYYAMQCQKHDRDAEALEAFEEALRKSPALAKDKSFRQMVRQSEMRSGREKSILPRRSILSQAGFWWAAVPATAALIYVAIAWFAAQNRTLHIVNGTPQDLSVVLDGGSPITVPASSRTQTTLAEGTHQWQITSPEVLADRGEVTLQTGFWMRPFRWKPVFILDPSRTAVTVVEEAIYAEHAADGRVNQQAHVGELLVQHEQVDFLFTELPTEIHSDRNDMKRTRVDCYLTDAARIVSYMTDSIPAAGRLDFFERHLRVNPKDEPLLETYIHQGFVEGQQERLHEFLKAGLLRRPVEIAWHRHYQGIAGAMGRGDEIQKEYDALLAAAPDDSALLYLRGRIEPNAGQAEEFCRRAVAADRGNPWPLLALSHRALSIGEFEQAKATAEKGLELKPDNDDLEQLRYAARFALGDFAALESELRQQLSEAPLDFSAQINLMEILFARGKADEAAQLHSAWVLRVQTDLPNDPFDFIPALDARQAYFAQQFEHGLAATSRLRTEMIRNHLRRELLLELDRFEEAAALMPDQPEQRGLTALYLFLGSMRLEQPDAAKQWLDRAVDEFRKGTAENRQLADALTMKPGPEMKQALHNVTLQHTERLPVLLTAAALTSGDLRSELLADAKRLNFRRSFPYGFASRTIDALSARQTESAP